MFENTETAFKLKDNYSLYNAKLLFNVITKKYLVNFLTTLTLFSLKYKLPVKWILKKTLYKHFCGGVDINECEVTIQGMKKMNVNSILDYSVEALKTEQDFDNACKKKMEIVDLSFSNDSIPFAVFKPTSLGRYSLFKLVNIKTKLSKEQKLEWTRVIDRFNMICSYAHSKKVRLLIDAEEFEVQEAIDNLVYKMMKKYNRKSTIVYNTIQLYRWDRIPHMQNLLKDHDNSFKFGFKLVRGAYMEKERIDALKNGYNSPICSDKNETDKNFNSGIDLMFNNINSVDFFIASHNEFSTIKTLKLMKKHGIKEDDEKVWFGQLYGMGDNISFNLASKGFNVAKILPFGPVENLMPYLIRRAQENSSVEGQSNRELDLINTELFRRSKAS
jgi:proline dehydrogenase